MAGVDYECRPGAAAAPLKSGYRPRRPEVTTLYQLVASELETFRREVQGVGDGAGLPGFVWREFERYLDCGILARGFARVRCPRCRDELLVGFSCTGKGAAPLSPTPSSLRCPPHARHRRPPGRSRAAPRALSPMGARTLSSAGVPPVFPRWLRPHLARDPALASAVQEIFLASVFAWQRKQARALGLRHVGVGAVTFAQHAGDSSG